MFLDRWCNEKQNSCADHSEIVQLSAVFEKLQHFDERTWSAWKGVCAMWLAHEAAHGHTRNKCHMVAIELAMARYARIEKQRAQFEHTQTVEWHNLLVTLTCSIMVMNFILPAKTSNSLLLTLLMPKIGTESVCSQILMVIFTYCILPGPTFESDYDPRWCQKEKRSIRFQLLGIWMFGMPRVCKTTARCQKLLSCNQRSVAQTCGRPFVGTSSSPTASGPCVPVYKKMQWLLQ